VAGPREELKPYVVCLQLEIPVVWQLECQGRNIVCDVLRLDEISRGLVSREAKSGVVDMRVLRSANVSRQKNR
jgi:hypothetical protein